MKIISKYKDYYDYLIGIYGVDEKIILDRTEFESFEILESKIITFFICGKTFDAYFYLPEKRFIFGQELLDRFPRGKDRYFKWMSKRNKARENTYVSIYDEVYKRFYNAHPLIAKDSEKINEKLNCPIICCISSVYLYNGTRNYVKYPKLSDLGIQKILPPQEIYLMLAEWLAPKDNIEDKMTDKEKIVAAGFDLKTSFRKG